MSRGDDHDDERDSDSQSGTGRRRNVKTPISGRLMRLKGSSSGNLRASQFYRPGEWLGRGSSAWSLPTAAAPLRRRGLRRRLTAALIVAALGPVLAVSIVAVLLIFSSVEHGIEFEAQRGLQVARGLFLQQVQQLAAGAAALGDDPALLRAQAAAPATVRQRLGELSLAMPNALYETTDTSGRIVAHCAQGACDEPTAARGAELEPSDRSPVILRALGYERTVSVERARDRLVVRAALPLVDPALRLLGAAVVTVPIDGTVVDRLKAALGAGREVVIYVGREPNASTFMAATGARLVGPKVPGKAGIADVGGLRAGSPVVPVEVDDGADGAADLVDGDELAHARRQPLLILLEAAGHDPEGLGQIPDLVEGVDLDAGVEIATRDPCQRKHDPSDNGQIAHDAARIAKLAPFPVEK